MFSQMLVIVATIFLLSTASFASSYYIDCAGGSDSHSGTSQTSAWQHHPYMVGFTGSYAHTAGDQFYFKGGVTCPANYFPLTVVVGGTLNHYDYYGPDPSESWFAGASWSRPIFGLAGATIGTANRLFVFGTVPYITADNFEVTGFKDNNDNIYQDNVAFLMNGDYQTVSNMYFHAWVVTGATHDDISWIHGCGGCSGVPQAHVMVSGNYCNGADATPPSTSNGVGSTECIRYIGGGTVKNNVMLNESNGIVFGLFGVVVTGNDCSNIWASYDPTDHENCFEWQGGGNVIANNKVHDLVTGSGVWPFVVGPSASSASSTDWVFNNSCWNVYRGCYDIDTQGNFPGYTANFYNNTAEVSGANHCIETTDRGATNVIGAANIVNNHCITPDGTAAEAFCFNQGSACSMVTTLTETTNLVMSAATATSQGYTSSETFAYSPTLTSNSTVGTGTNLTSFCSGNMAALCSDTTYSCSVGAGNILVCPARTSVSRSPAGVWDVGAYQYSSLPNPPTNLKVVQVQ